ncbi:MAG TPA: thioredoxin family protein [bacterium]|nr:thioredoxin family protein [bacterium]HOX86878.1 thioredoxin family protein [bacterium]HPG46209.1 thioredoxin family protein [bacterium]HPM98597.1 thioredoxin family protein [bacterium]
MQIKILGKGCPKCIALEEAVRKVADKNNIAIEVEKVMDINDIMAYGVPMTPGLVIDGEFKSAGKIPSEEQILAWLR